MDEQCDAGCIHENSVSLANNKKRTIENGHWLWFYFATFSGLHPIGMKLTAGKGRKRESSERYFVIWPRTIKISITFWTKTTQFLF